MPTPIASAISPFAGLENAQLSFLLLSNATAVDELGNAAPVYNAQPIAAYLKILTNTKTQELLQANAQVEPNSIALAGWCVSPTLLPETVKEETDAMAVFNRQQGLFRLVLINPPYGRDGIGAMVQAEAGTQIVGWFIPDRQADGGILPGPAPTPTPTPPTDALEPKRDLLTITVIGQTVFTLSATAQQPELSELYLNGVKAVYGIKYVIDGTQLRWLDSLQLEPGYEFEILYYTT